MAKKSGKGGVTNEKIMGFLVEMDERFNDMSGQVATKADVENLATKIDLVQSLKEYATKNDLEKFKEDILEEVRPLSKAIDKDAKTLIGHGKRIIILERKTGIAAK